MTLPLSRAQKLTKRERLAVGQEFREWLNGTCKVGDTLIVDTRIKKK